MAGIFEARASKYPQGRGLSISGLLFPWHANAKTFSAVSVNLDKQKQMYDVAVLMEPNKF